MQTKTVYIKIDQNIVIRKRIVMLQDIASIECTGEKALRDIKKMELFEFADTKQTKEKREIQVFSILKVIQLIHERYPDADVQSLGEADFIVEYIPEDPAKAWDITKSAILCVILFFGAAFTIMTFNNDVAVPEVFHRFYYQVTGTIAEGVTPLEVFYCVGLGVGILVFFNHIGKKKVTPDPTPVQVQMRKYEQDVDTTFIEDSGRKGSSIDVDD